MEGAKDNVTRCLLACFFVLSVVVCRAELQQEDQLSVKSYAYASFQPSDSPSTQLLVLGDADIHDGTLQLTPDGRNGGDDSRAHKSGSVLLGQPFTFWRRLDAESQDDQRVHVVSFNSTFTMSVAYHDGRALNPGEGLAFVIAPSSAGPPPGSQDGFLGLTNSTLEASPETKRFVAVEFDTVKQSYDPDDSHVGLDVGSVVSSKTASLAESNISIASNVTAGGDANYTVWIEYDGVARHVSVYMDVGGRQRPAAPVLDAPLDLSKHVLEKSYLGFSGSTGAGAELSSILDWTLTMETFPEKAKKKDENHEKKDKKKDTYMYYLCLFPAVTGVICVTIVWTRIRRDEKAMEARDEGRLEWLRSLPGMPTELAYEELTNATGNFCRLLREGWHGGNGPGSVYKGLLPPAEDSRSEAIEVAVKKYGGDLRKFANEIQLTSRLRHHNIVPIIGWCYHGGYNPKMLMVHEYKHACNGSLEQHIFRREGRPPLSWESRYRIISDVASGLHYMHHECGSVMLHGYLKPISVVLDASFRARISDLFYARVLADDGLEDTRPADVFAFGALVLEVVTGRRRRLDDDTSWPTLWDWVWQLHGRGALNGAVDRGLSVADFDQYEARRLLLLGLTCTRSSPGARPAMPQVLQIVSKLAPPPEVPLVKPPEDNATQGNLDGSLYFPAPPTMYTIW